MEKTTKINLIEIMENNALQIRIALSEDKDVRWHRTAIEPETDVDATFNMVNIHISQLGYPAISMDDVDRVKSIRASLT